MTANLSTEELVVVSFNVLPLIKSILEKTDDETTIEMCEQFIATVLDTKEQLEDDS